ncbi:unnamed protein product [Parnassius apollo]|uniref:(apollo) hypothetical protein n=1 Tax=Parnassius apollo TaxID=110799 RepID=A0A8S3XDF4_PARAO|nr:unnamed protein product [Parnassius apollo]
MDLLQLDDEEQEILQILAENGIKVTNPKKNHHSRIQILENILVYKPDNELLHAINIAAEYDPSFKCPKESPLEVDAQASNLGSLLSVATENGPEIEFETHFLLPELMKVPLNRMLLLKYAKLRKVSVNWKSRILIPMIVKQWSWNWMNLDLKQLTMKYQRTSPNAENMLLVQNGKEI